MNMLRTINIKYAALALGLVALVATASFLSTRAFFSDTETSAGNVFAAGSLDLMVGITGAGSDNDFDPKSIPGNQSLFIFENLIPGATDTGYFRLESSQDAWACIAADVQVDLNGTPENGHLAQEQAAGDNSTAVGELQNYMEIAIWEANNNNTDGVVGTAENDTLRVMSLLEFANGDYHALQDSATGDNPLLSGVEEQYEFAYCFGEFSNVTDVTNNGGTLVCDGSSAGNDAQTDSTEATIHFYAEQMLNNENFVCGSLNASQVVFALDSANSPGTDDNIDNEDTPGSSTAIQPTVDWVINGDAIEFTFNNPTPWTFVFDVRVDDEAGAARPGGLSPLTVAAGPLAGQTFGDTYQRVVVAPSSSTTQTFIGSSEIEVGLREGAENLLFIDWIRFIVS